VCRIWTYQGLQENGARRPDGCSNRRLPLEGLQWVHAAGRLMRPGLIRLVKERACVFVVFYKSWLRLVFACAMPPPGPKNTTV